MLVLAAQTSVSLESLEMASLYTAPRHAGVLHERGHETHYASDD